MVCPPTMNGQKKAVIQAPDNEGYPRTMPQAAEKHRDREVAIGVQGTMTVSTQRNIEVIAKPGGKADMPMPPETGGVAHEVRRPKILDQLEAHEFSEAACNIRIAGEIAIDLKSKRVNDEPRVEIRKRRLRRRKTP